MLSFQNEGKSSAESAGTAVELTMMPPFSVIVTAATTIMIIAPSRAHAPDVEGKQECLANDLVMA